MIPLAAKLIIGGLGFAGLLALGSSSASAKPAGASSGIPSDLAQRMVTALALGDPAKLRAVASELRARGFNADAEKLEAEAAKIEAGGKPSVTPPSSSAGTKPPASSPPTTASPPGALPGTTAGPVTDAKQLAAAAVARTPKDATKVRAFQTQEGLVSDGKYGPKSATALIKYGFVPPTPLAWPSDNNASRNLYVALLKAQADKDPVRREEWLQAAQAASLPAVAPAGTGQPASAPVSPTNIPILRQGSKGPNVVFLQQLLNKNGAALKQNGVFDSALRGTVIGFQKTHRNAAGILLKPDGVVGKETWTALGAFR